MNLDDIITSDALRAFLKNAVNASGIKCMTQFPPIVEGGSILYRISASNPKQIQESCFDISQLAGKYNAAAGLKPISKFEEGYLRFYAAMPFNENTKPFHDFVGQIYELKLLAKEYPEVSNLVASLLDTFDMKMGVMEGLAYVEESYDSIAFEMAMLRFGINSQVVRKEIKGCDKHSFELEILDVESSIKLSELLKVCKALTPSKGANK